MNNCREMNAGRGRESFFPVGRATVPRMDRRFSADRKKRLPTPSAPPLPVNTAVIHSPILSAAKKKEVRQAFQPDGHAIVRLSEPSVTQFSGWKV